MEAMGVSRTVVREAVAALKADGLVVTRQGSGAFVATDSGRVPFRIDPDGLSTLEAVIEVMELRLAVEVEAAARAAERASATALRVIERAFTAFEKAVTSGRDAIAEDVALHLAIADATGNPRFKQFLSFLGHHVIPRQSVRGAIADPAQKAAYLALLIGEHAAIVAAIRRHAPSDAARTMRSHLQNSLERYRSLANQLKRAPQLSDRNNESARTR